METFPVRVFCRNKLLVLFMAMLLCAPQLFAQESVSYIPAQQSPYQNPQHSAPSYDAETPAREALAPIEAMVQVGFWHEADEAMYQKYISRADSKCKSLIEQAHSEMLHLDRLNRARSSSGYDQFHDPLSAETQTTARRCGDLVARAKQCLLQGDSASPVPQNPQQDTMPPVAPTLVDEFATSASGEDTTSWPIIEPTQVCPGGMARARLFSPQSALNIFDIPLHYRTPIGTMNFRANYNAPAVAARTRTGAESCSNFGTGWTLNWVAYITLDGSRNATVVVPNGGSEIYKFASTAGGAYQPNLTSHAVLGMDAAGKFVRALPDGSVEVYDLPDRAGRIFIGSRRSPP